MKTVSAIFILLSLACSVLISSVQAQEMGSGVLQPAPSATVLPVAPPNADAKTAAAFFADCMAKSKVAEKAYKIAVAGKEGWLFFAPEVHHVGGGRFWGEAAAKVSRAVEAENADPLPAILDFKKQLDKAGIEFLFVPVPPKTIIYGDMVSTKVPSGAGNLPRLDIYHQEFYDLLRQNGIEVLDLAPDFFAARADKGASAYCKTDTHWSGRACVIAARRISALLKDRPWLAEVTKLKLQEQWKSTAILGDLTKIEEGKTPPKETLPLRFIGTPDKTATTTAGLKPVATSRTSPIVLLGDSHDLVFSVGEDMHTRGAGLPDQLAYELGVPVDLLAVRGSGATPSRTLMLQRAKANAQYLAGKRLVIWCFSSREFTETVGWQKVPVVR